MSSDSQPIHQKVIEYLAVILCYSPQEVGENDAFDDLGLDSVLGVEFLEMVNAEYGLDEQLDDLFDQETPGRFADYVARQIRQQPAIS